jgi:hypothetical protein
MGSPSLGFGSKLSHGGKRGFRSDTSEEYFRALLDEMVGLGILRVVDVDRYALRSHNVISLMGTEGEIAARLEADREAPLEYEPAVFRTAFRRENHVDASRRSPLTALQESELRGRKNGISVIVGCSASGIEELPSFLASAFGEEFFIQLEDVFDQKGFAERLNNLSGREKDGTTLLLVSPTCPWSEHWTIEAAQKLRNLTSKRSFVHIAFVADGSINIRQDRTYPPGSSASNRGTMLHFASGWMSAAFILIKPVETGSHTLRAIGHCCSNVSIRIPKLIRTTGNVPWRNWLSRYAILRLQLT